MGVLTDIRLRLAQIVAGTKVHDIGAASAAAVGLTSGIFGITSGAAPRRGTRELMAAYRQLPWLSANARRISTAVASTQWKLHLPPVNGSAATSTMLRYGSFDIRQAIYKKLQAKGGHLTEPLEEIHKHPFLDLLAHPNKALKGRQAIQMTQVWIDLKGEGYWVLDRNLAGMPIGAWPVPPHWITETPTKNRPTYRVSFKGWQGQIPETEVLAFRDPDPENPYVRGSGVAESLGDELDIDEYAAKHMKAWFYNKATPDMLIGVQGADRSHLEAAKRQWEHDHRGFFRAFRTHWHSGKIDVKQLQNTFADMQLVDVRKFERDAVQQVFGTPPEILGIVENSNRATIDAAEVIFARWVLVPRLDLLRAVLQEDLLSQFDRRLILDFESPIPADRTHMLDVAKAAPWALTRNEWRAMQGLPRDPEGDVYLVPLNLFPTPQGQEPVEPTLPGEPPPPEPEPDEPSDNPGHEPDDEDDKLRGAKQPIDVQGILDALDPQVLPIEMDPIFIDLVEEWGEQELSALGAEVAFNTTNPQVLTFLETQSGNRITRINGTTLNDLRETLSAGVREGESILVLRERVLDVFSRAGIVRANAIARTEVLRASNFGSLQGMRQSGVVDLKGWLSAKFGDLREGHLQLEEETAENPIPINDVFVDPDSGASALHPGGFGVPEADINCRCSVIAVVREPEEMSPERLEIMWRQFDRRLIPWERRVQIAARRAFRKQQEQVLDALNMQGPRI